MVSDEPTAAIVSELAAIAPSRLSGDELALFTTVIGPYFAHGASLHHEAADALVGLVAQHVRLGATRRPGEATAAIDGTRLWIVTDDMPFLVDSVSIAVRRLGLEVVSLVHPILAVRRSDGGQIAEVSDLTNTTWPREAWMAIELSGEAEPGVALSEVMRTLDAVRAVVRDWPAMSASAIAAAEDNRGEAADLLRWLADDHFTFLAAGVLRPGDDGQWRPMPGALGLQSLLVDPAPRFSANTIEVTRSHRRSPVHRPERVSLFDVHHRDGNRTTAIGRFVGLLSRTAHRQSVLEIPLVRTKVLSVLDRGGYPPDTFSGRQLRQVLEQYPRDELFIAPTEHIASTALGVLELGERRQVRVFSRHDADARLLSAQVYLPRERYAVGLGLRIAEAIGTRVWASSFEHTVQVDDGPLARVHVLADLPQAPAVDDADLGRAVAQLTRTWDEQVAAELGDSAGLLDRFSPVLHAGYRSQVSPARAARDLRILSGLSTGSLVVEIGEHGDRADRAHLRLVYRGAARTLTELIPLFGQLGLSVVEQHPIDLELDGDPVAIDEFTVEAGDFLSSPPSRANLAAAIEALWSGHVEPDGFNRLVTAAALSVDEVVILRSLARYLRQGALASSQSYIEQTLAAHPGIARLLVERFAQRFDPDRPMPTTDDDRVFGESFAAALTEVKSLDEDRILRAFGALIEAIWRTSWYRSPRPPTVAFKIDPRRVPDLPAPRPWAEMWVCGPRVEGVHLRFGPVARGGIRWSDRREDVRTEVLGLATTQVSKNAVIVPTGAKGGFVVKRPGDDGRQCYQLYVGALLDVTDNLDGTTVVAPDRVRRYDGDDPYLVVAADKGTASFSDTANAIAAERGFWLGDAFASGGSAGYDHKAMGITARGAWESVRRHARALGLDADRDELVTVGIGDMSGDVFGNGMQRSPHLKLVAAFDHRHIFIDPSPDPAASFTERQRLYDTPRSSWDDYDRSLISAGGGVWPRTAKSIPLSPEARTVLGIDATELPPMALMSAILCAPVDLLWNGGIGTYVKAAEEYHGNVGDRANDALRVNGGQLRCRIVAEGGNLGFTQRGRIEAALAGVLINTDAIDNSAGVDCSDHEVNIKIALAGALEVEQRNELLASMTDEVAAQVLADNQAQTLALAVARSQAASMVDVHARYLRALEVEGLIDRTLDALPTPKQLVDRQSLGMGLTVPEMATLLAYTKTSNITEVLASSLPDDPHLARLADEYFPTAMRQRFSDRIATHRLRREIIATTLVNEVVNRAGISFDFRMSEQHGINVVASTTAHLVAGELFELAHWWDEIDALGTSRSSAGVGVSMPTQIGLFQSLRRLVERVVTWLIHHRSLDAPLASLLEPLAPGTRVLAGSLAGLLTGTERSAADERRRALTAAGVPGPLSESASLWPIAHEICDMVDLAGTARRPVLDVAAVHLGLGDDLGLDWLRHEVDSLPRVDRWEAQSRATLRSGVNDAHRWLTSTVMTRAEQIPADALAAWQQAHARPLTRWMSVVTDAKVAGPTSLGVLTGCVGALNDLVRATAR